MISSDAALLVYRELDETFALTAGLKDMIEETRTGKNIQYSFTVLKSPYQHTNEETFQFTVIYFPKKSGRLVSPRRSCKQQGF